MRVIESKRNPKSGELYHYCPRTQDVAHEGQCHQCISDMPISAEKESAKIEMLGQSYRIHCPHGTEVKAIEPSHVDDQLPKALCPVGMTSLEAKFKLET